MDLPRRRVVLRISPDGKEIVNIHNDFMQQVLSTLADLKIDRVSDVYYCNKDHGWKIKYLKTGLILPVMMKTRQEAIDYEVEFLEEQLRLPHEVRIREIGKEHNG